MTHFTGKVIHVLLNEQSAGFLHVFVEKDKALLLFLFY